MRAGTDIRHVTLHLVRQDLPQASLALAELDAFVPDHRPLLEAQLPGIPGDEFRAGVRRARGYLNRLLAIPGVQAMPLAPAWDASTDLATAVPETAQWLADAWQECGSCDAQQHTLAQRLRELDQQEASLEALAGLELDLEMFHRERTYLQLNLGVVPHGNLERLRESLALTGHLVVNEASTGEHVRVLIAGQFRQDSTLDNVLSAAAFQAIDIPPSFRDRPDEVRRDLVRQRREILHEQAALAARIVEWRKANETQLNRAVGILDAAQPYTEVNDAARNHGDLAILQGWLPAAQAAAAQERLGARLGHPFVFTTRAPARKEYHLVPIPERRARLLAPFSTLVRQYGVPRFGEFEPTLLFALSFALMFGMMFGDIGHGAVFVALGLLLRRRLQSFTLVFVVAGVMAMIFGLLYGSIFGVEHWIDPLWIAPLSDPIYMLKVALGWGVFFLSLGSLIAIGNRLRAGDLAAATFDPGGILALVLYYALIGGLVSLATGDGFPLVASIVIGLALALLMGYRWMESDAPWVERALTVLIEAFEIVNGYVAGSLSFLRVAAFSLNHVALSMAVFTLAGMMDGFGHWVTLVLGNLFIIVLEGVIVGIQTLRLEYYEGFSRYFYGDGQPFHPLRLARRRLQGAAG